MCLSVLAKCRRKEVVRKGLTGDTPSVTIYSMFYSFNLRGGVPLVGSSHLFVHLSLTLFPTIHTDVSPDKNTIDNLQRTSLDLGRFVLDGVFLGLFSTITT